jgi:hypothetical protein
MPKADQFQPSCSCDAGLAGDQHAEAEDIHEHAVSLWTVSASASPGSA